MEISSDQKYPRFHLTYSSHRWHQYLQSKLLEEWPCCLDFFKATDYSTAQSKVLDIFSQNRMEGFYSLTWHSRLSHTYSPTHFPNIFSSCSSVPACLSQAECSLAFHSYSVALLHWTYIILKGPSQCNATWCVESLVIKLTPQSTSWK